MDQSAIIGVIGGMGPYAGLDLVQKVFDHTLTDGTDQSHLPVALLSFPHRLIDRSEYLFNKTDINPADAMAAIGEQLASLGATVFGMPCNTAHAPAIFDVMVARLAETAPSIRALNMIDETCRYIRSAWPDVRRVGVLSTLAVFKLGLYRDGLLAANLEPILPDETVEEHIVNRTIFDPSYGIKAQSNPVSKIARQSILTAIAHLKEKGADAVILGCTELPLAVPEDEVDGLVVIDPTTVLARALIRETYPDKLRDA